MKRTVLNLAATLRVGDRLSIDVMQSATRSVAAIFLVHFFHLLHDVLM